MKKVMCILLLWMAPSLYAALENMPDISSFNWKMEDDFSDVNYTLSNWQLNVPSTFSFGVNADSGYGYLSGSYSSNSYSAVLIPSNHPDAFGIRVDMRLSSLTTNTSSSDHYLLGVEVNPGHVYLAWGFLFSGNQLKGKLLYTDDSGSYIVNQTETDFTAVIGQTYNLGIVSNTMTDEFYFYLNGQKKTSFTLPDVDATFNMGYLRMYSKYTTSQFEFDNVQYAVPEPATMTLIGLGGLFLRRRVLQ